MAELEGSSSNSLFDTLADWNRYIKASEINIQQVVDEADISSKSSDLTQAFPTAQQKSSSATEPKAPSPAHPLERGPSL